MEVATPAGSVSVGVRELKNRLSAHLELVKNGQHIVVTERGRPIAMLRPVNADIDQMSALVAAGIVQPPRTGARRLPAKRVTLIGSSSSDEDVASQRR